MGGLRAGWQTGWLMYQRHWGLRESPFRTCLDPRFFYESPTHEEALARLHFLVDEHRRLGLLLGEAGSGKSLLLEVFAGQMRRQGRAVANLNLLGRAPEELLWSLAAALGLAPNRSCSPAALWRMLEDRLDEHRYQQIETVVLLDDAEEASPELLAQVARLAALKYGPDSRLTIILTAGRTSVSRLGTRLLELAELRIDVEPWGSSETKGYLHRSLAQAGRQQPAFDETAVRRLHELAHGIPRRVTQLAELALLAGADRQLDRVNADTVESVYRELGVIEV